MLITFAFILLFLNSALANDHPSLNAGSMINAASNGPTSSESFVAQTQRLLSNFDPKEFISSIQQWPQKIKIQAIQNAIHHGYLNSLGEQPEFLVDIGRWPSSVKMMVVNQAMAEENKKLLESILLSLNPNQKEDQKLLENILHRIFVTRENIKYLGTILKFSYLVPAESIESFYIRAASDGDMQILLLFLKNLNSFNSPEMVSKYGIDAEQIILQKALEAATSNQQTKSMDFIQAFLNFYMLRGKSFQEINQITRNMPVSITKWLVRIAYSRGEENIVETFFSQEDGIYVKTLLSWSASQLKWDDFIKFGLYLPAIFTNYILNHPLLPDRVAIFTRFLEGIREMPIHEMLNRDLYPEDLIRSHIFVNICYSGQLDLIVPFFENRALMEGSHIASYCAFMFPQLVGTNMNLAHSLISRTQIDAPTWMIYNGIVAAFNTEQTQMMDFLISKIDVSVNENFLLNLAIIAEDEDLVRMLLKHDSVLDYGLEEAIQYAITIEHVEIYNLLRQTKLILDSVNWNMVAPAA